MSFYFVYGVREPWDELSWAEMPEEAQLAWGQLGWDEDMWDDDDATPPLSDETAFEDLDPVGRAAAEALGYNEETWNDNMIRSDVDASLDDEGAGVAYADSDFDNYGSDDEEDEEDQPKKTRGIKPKKTKPMFGCC